MVDEVKEKLEEGYTEFGGGIESRYGSYFYPSGKIGRFLAKFFATKAHPYLKDEPDLQGDTRVAKPLRKPEEGLGFSMNRSSLILPEVELNRKRRYEEYERMDEYPEVGAAFDIYADDATQKDIKNKRWIIKSDSDFVVEQVEKLFEKIELDRIYWDIIRNSVKYGDCFIELVIDINNEKRGVQRIKVLNPKYILRIENEFGYLLNFLQEIPDKDSLQSDMLNSASPNSLNKSKFVTLDKNQIIHFRLHTSDPLFYPYGKSIAALAVRVFRSLKFMEDAMLIYRLTRAPERRIFYIDVGNLPASKSEMFMERLKTKFKKEKFYNASTGNIDARYNPLSADEDFFVPIRGGKGTKIETLQGAQNLGEVDDVKYFRDKLLAALKVPKDYMVEKDKSPERKANLSQLDVKFARSITRIQHSMEKGFESVAKKHLTFMGFPKNLIEDLRIDLPDPSDMFTKRKLDLDALKAQVVQSVIGLQIFPKKQILKEYYDMNEADIERMLKDMDSQIEKEIQQKLAAGESSEGGPGMPPPPVGGTLPAGAPVGPSPTGGEGVGNVPPTSPTREHLKMLMGIKDRLLEEASFDESGLETISRLIKKIEDKLNS